MVAIKDKEVTPIDVERSIETARRCRSRPTSRCCTLTQEFIIDGQDGVREPLGMAAYGSRSRCTSSPAPCRAAQNIVKCVRAAAWR